jgi:hypothetical protein
MSTPYEGDSNSPNTPGLSGMQASVPGVGVYGQSVQGSMVQALELPAPGSNPNEIDFHRAVHKVILQGVGVLGSTSQSGANGVAGLSDNGLGVLGASRVSSGVEGMSSYFDAIVGVTYSDAHAGVTGRNMTNGANGGVGIYGVGGQYAGKFDGTLQVNGDANITGTLTVKTDIVLPAADCAEEFDLRASAPGEPGTVMVLDADGRLIPSRCPYDKKVAGVVSGAGAFRPALILDRHSSSCARVPIALVGKVYCKVDAGYGSIEVGDLLTTSSTEGYAMKVKNPIMGFGAVIGKALRPLLSGRGLIPILIALQ